MWLLSALYSMLLLLNLLALQLCLNLGGDWTYISTSHSIHLAAAAAAAAAESAAFAGAAAAAVPALALCCCKAFSTASSSGTSESLSQEGFPSFQNTCTSLTSPEAA
jgi:hypothetical protein